MPTVAQPPRNMGDEGLKKSPLKDTEYLAGVIYNTAPFDCRCSMLRPTAIGGLERVCTDTY